MIQNLRHRFLPVFGLFFLLLFSFQVVYAKPPRGQYLQAKYAAIVIDAATGQVIHQDKANERRHPASLAKMMTLFKTFQALDSGALTKHQLLRVSKHAASQAPGKLGLRFGQTIRVHDAIMSLITKSANDAAVVLAEHLAGGTEVKFASMMTHQAQQLGMTQTVFKNASGLPNPHQVTTAHDMAKLSQALIKYFPHHYKHFATKAFSYKGMTHRNHNQLVGQVIGYKEEPIIVDGIKTGLTNASGFNLAASAKHKGRRLISVVMGGANRQWRDQRVKRLLVQGFQAASTPRLMQASLKEVYPNKIKITKKVKNSKAFKMSKSAKGQGVQKKSLKAGQQASVSVRRLQKASGMSIKKPRAAGKHAPGKWRIQVGAYGRDRDARTVLQSVKTKVVSLKGAKSVSILGGKSKKLYRAQFVNLSQRQAQNSCVAVRKSGFECMAIAG